jgi:hypothetical protein
MAGKTKLIPGEAQVIPALDRIVALHVHIVTGYGTGYFAIYIQREVPVVHYRGLADAMPELNPVALTADLVNIFAKPSLGGRKGEPAAKICLRRHVTDLTIPGSRMGIDLSRGGSRLFGLNFRNHS